MKLPSYYTDVFYLKDMEEKINYLTEYNDRYRVNNVIKHFIHIEIELFNYCNRTCWFCPNSLVDRKSQKTYLSKNVYIKILEELKENHFKGCVSYSRYNEPFSDLTTLEYIEIARTFLPSAQLISYTNGDYIDKELLYKIEKSSLNKLYIQNYDLSPSDTCEQIKIKKEKQLGINFVLHEKRNDKIEYYSKYRNLDVYYQLRISKENYNDRAGLIKSLHSQNTRKYTCIMPFYNIYIDYNGNVMPCCNMRSDFEEHKQFIFGNLYNDKLSHILYNEKSCQFRKELLQDHSNKQIVCSKCKNNKFIDTDEKQIYLDSLIY